MFSVPIGISKCGIDTYTNILFNILHGSENVKGLHLYDGWFWYLTKHINKQYLQPFYINTIQNKERN